MSHSSDLVFGNETRTVTIPSDFFLKACTNDYNDYRSALPREIFQNSIDAKAKTINCVFNYNEKSITVTDDGTGMDRDIILNKLLVMGGSSKSGSDSVGHFGKAKELIFFAWNRYEIHTNTNLVQGKSAHYTIQDTKDEFQGTKIKLFIDDEDLLFSLEDRFRDVAALCNRNCKIFVNDDLISYTLKNKRLMIDYGWAKLYRVKCPVTYGGYPYLFVCVNGIWMFTNTISRQDICKYNYILDVDQSVSNIEETLTSNRDGFKSGYRYKYRQIEEYLSREGLSSQRNEKKVVERKITGKGVLVFKKEEDAVFNDRNNIQLDDEQVEVNRAAKHDIDSVEAPSGYGNNDDPEPNEIASWNIERAEEGGQRSRFDEHLRIMLESIGWKHSFEVVAPSKTTEATAFLKSDKCARFTQMWIEALAKVCADNDLCIPVTPGLIFDMESDDDGVTLGRTKSGDNGEYAIFANPLKLVRMKKIASDKTIWRDKKAMFKLLLDLACHEIAHTFYPYHDERFASQDFTLRCNLV